MPFRNLAGAFRDLVQLAILVGSLKKRMAISNVVGALRS